jgi:hypothetical protein
MGAEHRQLHEPKRQGYASERWHVFSAWLTGGALDSGKIALNGGLCAMGQSRRRPSLPHFDTTLPIHVLSFTLSTRDNGASEHAPLRDAAAATAASLVNRRLPVSRPLCRTAERRQYANLILLRHESCGLDELVR